MKQLISAMLGVRIVDCHERYLGLPTMTRRNKTKLFIHVREMLWKKLNAWNGKLLSAAGKEVLIKVVGQTLPTYTMGIFQLPTQLRPDILAMIAHYWWGKAGRRLFIGFVGCGILWGHEVVEEGLVWRVGNGASILVFQDKWIPKPNTFRPLLNKGLNGEALVADLITPSEGWDLQMLEQALNEEDCEAV
ncbi:unnamed protein product [Prunus armeniaca]